MDKNSLEKEIFKKIKDYYRLYHKPKRFISGKTKICYAGRVYDDKEMVAMTRSILDFWLTLGKEAEIFQSSFGEYSGLKNILLVNSGSSANLLAISSLKSKLLKNRLCDGDEVITTALAFPSTIAPIIQNNLIPVFVDVEIDTFNIDTSYLKRALSRKTKAILVTHTMGNPCKMDTIVNFAKNNNLFLIEDVCDALGGSFSGKKLGTFGDIATYSFYPAHHITLGEGGALGTNNFLIYRAALSLRDWGRDCYCRYNEQKYNGACNNRFGFKYSGLPQDYDHKYIYTHIGYNLKPLDIQAAMGQMQLKKLPNFLAKRKENFEFIFDKLNPYKHYLQLPRQYDEAGPAWFCFPITIKKNKKIKRLELVRYLESNNIETRMIFAGNILRQPGFKNINCRVIGTLENTNYIMENSFFIGVYPGLSKQKLNFMTKTICSCLNSL